MNAILNQWINNLYRHGAIDVDGRDEFKNRLNVRLEDFEPIVIDMGKYMQYMTTAYQTKWRAFIGVNFPRAAGATR
jgi:hypothetical protein